MAVSQNRILTRAALLLALVLLFQSLRLVIPVPMFFSTFVIGSLVNACLLVAVETTGFGAAAVIALVAPVVAYFQQLLLLPVFIVPVALGNLLYVSLFRAGLKWGRWQGVGVAAIGKTVFLWGAFAWLLTLVSINPPIAAGLMFVMSWPQLVTTVMGGVLALAVIKRIK